MKRFLSVLCVLAMLLSIVPVAAFAAAQDLQALIDAGADEPIVLEADASNITVTRDTYVDLNGHDINGVTVLSGTLYCLDSQTADYTVADGVYGKVTNATGAVKAAEGYLQVGESFHAVNLDIYAMTLRAADVGVYYKSNFAADEIVAAQVESFGVALSVVTAPNASNLDSYCGYSVFEGFEAGEGANSVGTSTLLKGIMKASNGDNKNAKNASMPVYGRAYIKTADGYFFGETVKRSLQEQVEAIDKIWNSLTDSQKNPVLGLLESYTSVMESWNIPNIMGIQVPGAEGEIEIDVPVNAENGTVTEAVTVEQAGVSVTVPAGTKLAAGAEKLTVTVTPKEVSDAGLTLEESEVLMPMDVHVDGLAADNAAPLTIYLGKVMAENLNMGNYAVYHVENGKANEMTLIGVNEEFTAHNQYKYTLDGELTLYMATFSEVAVVSETAKWEGGFDYSWYDASKTEFEIRNADQLAAFGAIVGGMANEVTKAEDGTTTVTTIVDQDSFSGKTVKLLADIDLNDAEENNHSWIFHPIGYWNNEGTYERLPSEQRVTAVSSGFYAFEGTFDGNGNTISNFYHNTWEIKGDHNWYDTIKEQYFRDGMGLFGKVYGGTVKNLTVSNFSSDGEIATTGVIAAYADCGATFENIAIFDCNPRVYNIGNGGIVGCVGWYTEEETDTPVTFKNISVDQSNKISALWGTYDVSCGGIVGQYYAVSGQTSAGSPKNAGMTFTNCHVAAVMDVHNDVCANYQYYWYRYSGMMIGTIRANTTDANGYTVADTTGIKFTDCTYTLGDWNQYWYCELVKNSLASYTHDHQFSRLTTIASLSEIKDGETWLKEGNFVIPNADNTAATCYHIFKDSEGNLYQHFHDSADESNNYSPYETIDVNGDGDSTNDLKEDRTCYFMPFNQVFNGLGYGVKPTYAFEGITEETDGTVEAKQKFESLDTVKTYRPKQTITLGELFELIANETKLSEPSVYAAVSPATDSDDVSATFSKATDWENSTITFAEDCVGTAKIVITDYFYCKPTVIYLDLEQAAEKFTKNDVAEQNAYTQITLGTVFGVVDGATICNVTATVTDPTGTESTISGTSENWTSQTIDLTKDGTWTVTIKDDDAFCAVTTVTFEVKKADKFIKKFDKDFLYRVGNENAFNIGYIFGEVETAVALSSVNVTIDNFAGDAAGTFTSNATWTNGTIQFTGSGVVKVTISAEAANDCVLYLEVVDAFNATDAISATKDTTITTKVESDVVLLCNISGGFTVSDGYTFCGNGFTVRCAGKGTVLGTAGMYQGFINVKSGGVLDNVQVICDIYPFALLYASEAKDHKDEDASTADKTRNMYQLSAIAVTGNGSKIWNSYVYGGRNNIYVGDGNVTIENTTTKNGTLANIQLKGSDVSTVILRDVTTIQNKVVSTYDATKTMLGCGILVGDPTSDSNPNVVIENTWNSYNWVTAADANEISSEYAKNIINAAVANATYAHTNSDGEKTANLALIVLNEKTARITDQRTNQDNYLQSNVDMQVKDPDTGMSVIVTGQVYSVINANGNPDAAAPVYTAPANAPYKPAATKDTMVAGQYDSNDGGEDTRYCYWEDDLLKLMYKENEAAFTLPVADLVAFTKHSHTLSVDAVVTKNGGAIAADGGNVTFTDAGTYTITYTIQENYNFDKDGVQISEPVQWTFTYDVEVSLVKNAGKNAEISVESTSFYGAYGKTSSLFDPDFHYCIPFMSGVTITDYAEDGVTPSTFDATKNIISIVVEGDKTSGTVTITYLDGRKLVVTTSGHSVGLGSSGNTISVKAYSDQLWICTDGVSNNATTGTWKVNSYKFTGNNGVPVEYTTARTCNFDSASTTNSPQPGWSSYTSPSVDSIKYTVTYNANGGSCAKAQAYATASNATVILPTATRSGYIFAGWYTATVNGTRVGGAGDSYPPSANITLYAMWGKPCTVTYDANGGSCDISSEKYTGTALKLPEPSLEGYGFAGWFTAAENGTRVGLAGADYHPEGDITLYAQWSPIYEVIYNENGGTCNIASETYSGVELTLPTPSKEGYTFLGWYDAATSGNKIGDAGESYTPEANITLYAQWKINSYTIKVTTSNASVSGVTNGQTVAYGATVSVTVSFDKNNSKTLTVTNDTTGVNILNKDAAGTYTFTMPASNVTINASSTGCFAEGTLITMADGSQKPIEEITYSDELLAWDLHTGAYVVTTPSLIESYERSETRVINLNFADGTTVRITYDHGFFDMEENNFVFIDESNVASYVGHEFVKVDENGTYTTTEMVSYEITVENVAYYTIQTAIYNNCIAENMFTLTSPPEGVDGWFDYFEIGEGLKYDEEKMQAEIEKYGLYTYEDFAEYVTYEQFIAFNGPYLKVLVGRGVLTYEDILQLIATYVN